MDLNQIHLHKLSFMKLKLYSHYLIVYLFVLMIFPVLLNAQVDMKKQGNPQTLIFQEGNQPSVSSFFDEYKQAFPMSDGIQMEEYKVSTDKIGTHHRYNQYYKGIEILGAQYVLHEKNDAIWYANGQLIHNLDMDVKPGISEENALAAALANINADVYMWENPNNDSFLKNEQNDPNATFYPKGELKLTSGKGDLSSKTMRLVYRFDIYAQKPLSRNWVDVDAKTGEIVNVTSRIHNTDLVGKLLTPATDNEMGNGSKAGAIGGRECTYCDAYTENASEEWISNLTFNTINNSQNSIQTYEDFTYLSTDVFIGETYTASVSCGSIYSYVEQIWLYFDWNADCDFDDPGESYHLGQTLGPGTLSMDITIPDITSGSIRMRAILSYSDNPVSACDTAISFGQVEDYSVNVIAFTAGDVQGSGISYYNGNVDMIVDEYSPNNYRLRENTTRPAPIHTFSLQNSDFYSDAVDIVSPDLNGSWDGVGISAHWGTEATYDYFSENFGRNSIDDMGLPLLNYVHAGVNFNNAFWDGSRMTYGDGDGINYNPLVSIDIIAHELTHGVTEFTSNLFYSAESGALNESFSDIFGNLVEFQEEGIPGSGTGSWRMGEDMTINGPGGIRNMENPNEFGQPDTYYGSFWFPVNSTTDNGGVHVNSGVQNFWFYLLSTGGSGTNDKGFSYNVTGIGTDNAASIAYHNNTSFLTPFSNHYNARQGSIACAEALFGVGSQEAISTADAWDAVGVYHWPAPENDECTGAIPLSCGETITGNTSYATFDADAPFCDTEHTSKGVWYTVVGDGSTITASMCGGRVYDARMTVYTGSCDTLVCVGADDDGCGGYGNVSKFEWLSTEGTSYYILIHGWEGSAGEFTLSINGLNPETIAINPPALNFNVVPDESTSTVMTVANEGSVCTKDLNWIIYKNGVANTSSTVPGNSAVSISEDPFVAYGKSPILPNHNFTDDADPDDHEIILISSDGEQVAPAGPPVFISGSGKTEPNENRGPLTSVVEPITLSHSLSQALNGVTLACLYTNLGYTSTNGYIRDFQLNDFGVTSEFNLTEVEIGVRKAVSGSGSQPIVIYLATWNPDNTVTLIDSANFQVPDQQLTMLSLPVSAIVPANSRLLVQVVTRDGLTDENTFIVAANDGGQTAPSYLYGPGCSADNYFWDVATYWGYPQIHYVMNVKGFAEVTDPWLTVTGGAGNTESGSIADVTLSFDATGLMVGTYSSQLRVNNNSGSGTTFIPVTMNVIDPLQIDLTVMLEGPYSNGNMTTGLGVDFPLEQPYNTPPWNYGGDETIVDVSPDYVDWVLVEIRDAVSANEATSDKVVGRQAALLKSNGQIVDAGGNTTLRFSDLVNDNLFVVIHHRNHLSIISSNFLAESNGVFPYDFTTGEGQALGGTLGHKNLGSGIWGMISGDGDRNGFIDLGDKSPMWDNEAGSNGYLFSDYNLDGESDNVDKNDVLLPNTGRGSQVPN